jgi:hypothetical protein
VPQGALHLHERRTDRPLVSKHPGAGDESLLNSTASVVAQPPAVQPLRRPRDMQRQS